MLGDTRGDESKQNSSAFANELEIYQDVGLCTPGFAWPSVFTAMFVK